MTRVFRIHGDNIVECERIAKLILEETDPTSVEISLISPSTFEVISAAAYLRGSAQANRTVFERSNCDMLFIMEPVEHGWEIEIVTATRSAEILKEFICEKVAETGFNDITLF